MNIKKILTIWTLPIIWFVYILFEIISGRITDVNTFVLNIGIMIVFAIAGLIIYKIAVRYEEGLKARTLLIVFFALMLIDQGIKIIIKFFFFNDIVDIIPNLLSFSPIINTHGSWLNARFDASVSFSFLIILNIIALFVFFEIYRYSLHKGYKSFWIDMCFMFIFCGALCSLIDKVFYGGSLDFIGISNLFIADIKDIYINIGILFFAISIYTTGYLTEDSNSSIKDDLKSIKLFLDFILNDLKGKYKLFK